ncbi:MAG: hypothetical protein Q7T93_16860 [Methylobacterium sp.]|nr:hypothetical protein [Methylobacterium sp.]
MCNLYSLVTSQAEIRAPLCVSTSLIRGAPGRQTGAVPIWLFGR